MAAIIGILCIGSIISSFGLGALYSGGMIPGTGPKFVSDSGLDKLKTYVPIAKDLHKKISTVSDDREKTQEIIETFVSENESKLKDFCKDFNKVLNIEEDDTPKEVFTLSGIKRTNEYSVEYIGGEEIFSMLDLLFITKKCLKI